MSARESSGEVAMEWVETPSGPLAEFVSSIWMSVTDPSPTGPEVRLATGEVDLVFIPSTGEAIVAGPATRPRLFHPDRYRDVIGLTFRPGHARPLLNAPLHELREAHVSLRDLWGNATVDEISEHIREESGPPRKMQALARLIAARAIADAGEHRLAAAAASRIRANPGDLRVGDLSESLGPSLRHLQHVARTELGMSLKAYQRLHRFRSVLDLIDRREDVGWAGLAVASGHYDQSHLIAAFREHAGMTPSAYLRARGRSRNHLMAQDAGPHLS
jgi:AraC-like DNA-binding protein